MFRGILKSRLLRIFSIQAFSALFVVTVTVVGPQLGVLYADSPYTVSGTVNVGPLSVSGMEVAAGTFGLNVGTTPPYPVTDSTGNYSTGSRLANGTYEAQIANWNPSNVTCRDGTSSCNTVIGLDLDAKKNGGAPITVNGTDVTQNFSIPTVPLTVTLRDANGNLVTGGNMGAWSQSGQAVDTSDSSITYVTDPAAQYLGLGTAPTGVYAAPTSYTDSNGSVTFYVVPGFTYQICASNSPDNATIGGCKAFDINSASSVEIDLNATNLTASLQGQTPVLAWDGTKLITQNTHYVIYRNGTQIGTTTTPSYTDNNAPNGTDTYYINTIDRNGTYGTPSNTVSVVVSSAPSAPSNLTATSPAQNPSLNWTAVSGATSYNIYRNGTNVGSTTTTTYTDNAAPESTDTYYVTAVNTGGESTPSNNASALVDRTAPTITYTVSPSPNGAGWNNAPVTVTFACNDNTGGSGIASCSTPQTESADGTYTLTGTAVDKAGNSSSVSVTVNLDQTAPTLSTPSWTNNPMTTTQSTTVTVPVSDNLSGVLKGEYYLGTTDPGQGSGTAMTLNNGNLSTSFNNQTPGIYAINFRAKDTAGNWSPVTTDYLVVYDTTKTSADGHSGDIEPMYGTDVLPGLLQTGQHDKEHFAFTVKYKNGTLDPASTVHFDYKTGTHCNNPNQATNCHNTTLDATSLAWMVINGTNNSQATIQGTATLTVDGVTTTNPFRIITTDGSLLTPQTTDQFELDIYAPGANPNTAQPIYHLNDPLAKGNVVVKS